MILHIGKTTGSHIYHHPNTHILSPTYVYYHLPMYSIYNNTYHLLSRCVVVSAVSLFHLTVIRFHLVWSLSCR